ncbi:MAG: peptidase S41 [Chitinophagaceae bacterium]|nr:MAG: peptidase S41 [Chitinophagaceae bacterium]
MLLLYPTKKLIFAASLIFCCFTSLAQNEFRAQAYFSDPALSPDAKEIAFVSGGDIWTMPADGSVAQLLISHPSYESRPVYSPDGKSLAFMSTRTGNGDIYSMELSSGKLRRLTFDDAADELSAWSADGYIYFSSASKDIAGMRDIYRMKSSGGTPMPISRNEYVAEYFGMPSPDGKTLALSGHGNAAGQWWRNGHSHIDESEIWLMQIGNGSYEKITEAGAKHVWPMWSRDGKSLYYISDKSGAQNLYVQPLKGVARQLTQFKKGRLLWPSIAANGEAIVFERDFNIWYYDIASGKPKQLNITRRGMPATVQMEHRRQNNDFGELSLSPDGKKMAFIARGEVFLIAAKEGGDAMRVTNTLSTEADITWATNSNSIVYTANRDEAMHLYEYNFITKKETQLTSGKADDGAPKFSPDGKFLAFIRDGKELRKLDMQSKKESLVARAGFTIPIFVSASSYSWSPDGEWIAYAAQLVKSFVNLQIVSADGGTPRTASFLANSSSGNVEWSKNGQYILYSTTQRTEDRVIARVDLMNQVPKFREEQIQKMFMDPMAPAAPTPPTNTPKGGTGSDSLFKPAKKAKDSTTITWDGIAGRLNILPLGIDVSEFKVSPDGNTLALISAVAGQTNIFTYSLDEFSREPAVLKQLTTTPGGKFDLQFSPDGKELFFTEQGRIQSVNMDSRQVKSVSATAAMDVDFEKEKMEVFLQIWEVQNKGFYDPAFHGADWAAVKKTYEPLAAGAATGEEFRRIMSMMVGELNASHLGIGGPAGSFTVGRAGLLFDRLEYENNNRLKIARVVAMGPAALSGKIKVGDYLTAVDGRRITTGVNLDELFDNKINKMLTLSIAPAAGAASGEVAIRPVNVNAEKDLLYNEWVQQQRAYVNKISNGRLGYVHMIDMSMESLNQLYVDLDVDNQSKEGVVIDVRNNNGGFVNGYAIDVFSRKGYLNMTRRGMATVPARAQLGQRALDAPTILVTNQHSLSDAEDFTEGYRALKLGKVVGEPTAGWIVFTSNITLFDGTLVRLPHSKITDLKGVNMELNPRPVDITVSNPLGLVNKDNQLQTAVAELLRQIGSK